MLSGHHCLKANRHGLKAPKLVDMNNFKFCTFHKKDKLKAVIKLMSYIRLYRWLVSNKTIHTVWNNSNANMKHFSFHSHETIKWQQSNEPINSRWKKSSQIIWKADSIWYTIGKTVYTFPFMTTLTDLLIGKWAVPIKLSIKKLGAVEL